MKKVRNKLLIVTLLIIILCNFIMPHYIFASDSDFDYEAMAQEQESMATTQQTIPLLGGVVELLLDAVKLGIVIPGMIMCGVNSGLGSMAGNDGEEFISLYNVLFNQLGITDINILELTWGMQRINVKADSAVWTIRNNIAIWYYGIRNLSIVILLCVLIYMGIRMAITTVAEDRARYKQLLMYWFTALVLVFMLHYIIILVININTSLVSIIKTAADGSDTASKLEAYNGILLERAFGSSNVLEKIWVFIKATVFGQITNISASLGAAIIYTVLNGMTFAFLMLYIRRMITVSFYILIAPIVTITYPIDKIGDRKIASIKHMA